MGFDNWESFLVVLNRHRNTVTRCFAGIVAENVEGEAFQVEAQWIDAWTVPSISEVLQLRTDIAELDLTEEVLETLDKLMPRLLKLCESTENPSQSRIRMMPVVRAVLRRSTYLVFLVENHEALARAVQLVSLSNWISEQLEAYPILLYELTDRSIHDVSVSRQELEGKLREQMRTVEAGDLESQMDTLRQFRRATMLKIAAMELLDELSIMQTSDGLTALAEVILDSTIDIAWQHLEAKHGLPCDSHGEPLPERIAVIAYGKAGGLELAYGSDLDLVFICPDMITGNTDGARSINNNVFFVRLGQRMIHILTSFTRFGVLYEADLRLRPQGNKGPLVATMNAFSRYQQNEAWTWEHQALIRARFVAGDPSLAEKFAEVRRMIIQQQRDRTQLLTDVLDMREKMRTHLSSGSTTEDGMEVLGKFDLKHDTGAIVDIEFMVQYAVLGWGEAHQSLSRWTDVMRLLDELSGTGVFTESQAESLQRAYLAFRAAIHHEWLGLETDYERLQGYRQEVKEIWDDRMLASVVNPDEQDR
jgi:glutamate-ammonia-ligase adenylyltransferase